MILNLSGLVFLTCLTPFLYQSHACVERKKCTWLPYLNFIQLLKCFLPSCLRVKLSGAVDNFKLPLPYQMIEGAIPACLPSLLPQVTTRNPKPMGRQPSMCHSQQITREQGYRYRPIGTVTYVLSNRYLTLLLFIHSTHSMKGCIGAWGGGNKTQIKWFLFLRQCLA